MVFRSRAPVSRERPGNTLPPPRKRNRPQFDNLTAASHKTRPTNELERESDDAARRVNRGERAQIKKRESQARSVLPSGSGHPLRPELREAAEQRLGIDASGIRVHDDREAQLTASALGARAFADGANIWLGPGTNELDRDLMVHELSHVAQGEPGLQLRSATWLERRAWLSFFDHYLPRKFLNNYMDDTGAPITLTLQEMIDVNPIVNIRRSRGFAAQLAALQAKASTAAAAGTPSPAVAYIEVKGPGQALTNGTLGNFTITYKGILTVMTDGNWIFNGFMEFYDVWDFDPKPFGTSGRSPAGEVKTRVAAYGLPGQSFEIFSVPSPCFQSGTDKTAGWAGGTPQHIGDQAGRSALDIEVGAGAEVPGGPEAETGGGEVGAQSSEDLNP